MTCVYHLKKIYELIVLTEIFNLTANTIDFTEKDICVHIFPLIHTKSKISNILNEIFKDWKISFTLYDHFVAL